MEKQLQNELESLIKISSAALEEYKEKKDVLIKYIEEEFQKNPSMMSLIGHNPLAVMHNNHKNHIDFMINVFHLEEPSMMIKIIPWVYRSYHSKGFSYEYFIEELQLWIKAFEKFLAPTNAHQIIPIYQWMIKTHKIMISLSEIEVEEKNTTPEQWKEVREEFLQAILEGQKAKAVSIAKQVVQSQDDIIQFYIDVVQSCMEQIGMMWEKGEISVAREHLASTIVSHVISIFYMMKPVSDCRRGKAIVTAAPNEFHQLGAWMISDLLELDGWDVRYLGANTPIQDLLDMLLDFQPDLLFISITMPFNVIAAQEIIKQIHAQEKIKDIKILVGGLAMANFSQLSKKIQADAMGLTAKDAIEMARQWQVQKGVRL